MTPQSPVLPNTRQELYQEVVFARNQPQYLQLPAALSLVGSKVITRWKPTWKERLTLIFGGCIYLLAIRPAGDGLQPVKLQTVEPTLEDLNA